MNKRKRGRPRKSEPKYILGFIGQLGSPLSAVTEYLSIRYGFTVVDLQDISRKQYIDEEKEPQKFDEIEEIKFREKFPKHYFVKKAYKNLLKAGRPFNAVSHIYYDEETQFFREMPFSLVTMLAPFEIRYRQYVFRETSVSLQEFKKRDKVFTNQKRDNGLNLTDLLKKADYTITFDENLGTLYLRIEEILQRINKNNEHLEKFLVQKL